MARFIASRRIVGWERGGDKPANEWDRAILDDGAFVAASDLPDAPSAATSYMLFDTETANALGSYPDVIEARVALRQVVELNPGDADNLVLIGYDEAGMPVGEAVTFADLPPYTVTVEDSPWLA